MIMSQSSTYDNDCHAVTTSRKRNADIADIADITTSKRRRTSSIQSDEPDLRQYLNTEDNSIGIDKITNEIIMGLQDDLATRDDFIKDLMSQIALEEKKRKSLKIENEILKTENEILKAENVMLHVKCTDTQTIFEKNYHTMLRTTMRYNMVDLLRRVNSPGGCVNTQQKYNRILSMWNKLGTQPTRETLMALVQLFNSYHQSLTDELFMQTVLVNEPDSMNRLMNAQHPTSNEVRSRTLEQLVNRARWINHPQAHHQACAAIDQIVLMSIMDYQPAIEALIKL
jgi:hypothetical protein